MVLLCKKAKVQKKIENVWTDFVDVTDVSWSATVNVVDATSFDSDRVRKVAGLPDYGTISGNLLADPTSAVCANLFATLKTPPSALEEYRLIFPTATNVADRANLTVSGVFDGTGVDLSGAGEKITGSFSVAVDDFTFNTTTS